MRLICDVHISYKVVSFFKGQGHECIHVNFILAGSFTKDSEIANFVDSGDYILISKDSDFKISFLLNRKPKKLVKINLGNISNLELVNIFKTRIELLEKLNLKPSFMLEIGGDYESYTE
ncbi:DUF5615 family PIN-like protein [Algoriphagus chordae]|uniref:Putative nuclease of predicted toxin-antitoxin system n=1 Tax=Algoriphagus chordae TaxID=237019 RepID=A0A2W7R3M1_9BACT|nr:DUF5615 family PIN-like protein [Algoriphagus chordae]PZX48669.1 putative nuclease of predicted toxin-antitoxin system [Algoriphagus chordae]